MLNHAIISNNPDNFNEIEFEANIPWRCKEIEYRITNISFQNFLVTTIDDYIVFEYSDGAEIVFDAIDKSDYDEDTLTDYLTTWFHHNSPHSIKVERYPNGLLEFSSQIAFYIKIVTHRMKLLLGLMNYVYPGDFMNAQLSTERPSITFNNLLYLRSTTIGESVQLGDKNTDLLYVINQFMIPSFPVIIDKKGIKIKRPYSQSLNVKISLTDAYLVPIVLKSPLFICLQITPIF